MVRSRTVALVVVEVLKWAIPLLLVIITGIVGFLYNNVRLVEAKFDSSTAIHEKVHHKVNTIDFNLRLLFNKFNLEYIDPEEKDR